MPDPDRIARARRIIRRAFPRLGLARFQHAVLAAVRHEDATSDARMTPADMIAHVLTVEILPGEPLIPPAHADDYRTARAAAVEAIERGLFPKPSADADPDPRCPTCGLPVEEDHECPPGFLTEPRAEAEVLDRPTMRDLLDRSSLGTPEAQAAIASVPPERAEEIVRRANGIAADGRWIVPMDGGLIGRLAAHPDMTVIPNRLGEWRPPTITAEDALLRAMAGEREVRREIQRELVARQEHRVVLGVEGPDGIEVVGPGTVRGTADAFTFTPDRASDLAESSLLDRCPQPCDDLSQHDAAEGRTCDEHPCTCPPAPDARRARHERRLADARRILADPSASFLRKDLARGVERSALAYLAEDSSPVRYPGPGVPPAVYVVRGFGEIYGVFHMLDDARAEHDAVPGSTIEAWTGTEWEGVE